MMSIYTDVKIEKMQNLLDWLREERRENPSAEINKLIKRLEQQITFLKLPEEEGKKFFDNVKNG